MNDFEALPFSWTYLFGVHFFFSFFVLFPFILCKNEKGIDFVSLNAGQTNIYSMWDEKER